MSESVSYEIVHSLKGRVRVRISRIRCRPELAGGLAEFAAAQTGVLAARANPDCGSLSISFQPGCFDPLTWLNQLDLSDVKPRTRKRFSRAALSPALAALHRATYHFESKLPPRAQFLLGTLSLVAALPGMPVLPARALIALALAPILNRAVQTTLDERRVGADVLDFASGFALLQQGYYFPASVMVFLVGLGELIRDLLTSNCQHLIAHQLALSRRSAWVLRNKRRVRVPVEELKAGERLVVFEGELISFSGTIVEGEGTVVPANPRADYEPQMVRVKDRVAEGTVLTDGTLHISFEHGLAPAEKDPVLEKEKRRWLQRTRLHRRALRNGYRKVLPVLSTAALVFALTRDFPRAIALINFDFITGVKIAIPTAVLSAMYRAGGQGVVIRSASALERLAEVDTVVFARSGSLTSLRPAVTDSFLSDGFDFYDVMRLAAAVEQKFNHLGAYAIYRYAHLNTIPVPERTSSDIHGGLGVSGFVEGKEVLVGSTLLMEERGIDTRAASEFLEHCLARGESRVCIAIDQKLAGAIAYHDPLRPEAADVIQALKDMGIIEIAMTTAGSDAAARTFAKQAGISKVHSRVLPEDQAEIVKTYRRQGHTVAVVGHDLDDAPAMEQADVAITLASGVDVARYRADVVLSTDDLNGLVEGIEIARAGMALARENLQVVSLPNWCGLALTTLVKADPLTATLLNNGSVIVGAANGLRPLLDGWDGGGKHEVCLI